MPPASVARPPRRRVVAGLAAAAVALSGAIVLTPSAPATAAYPDTFNPFAISGGYTVYAREDASLGNQETEGSIAVGGTLTKPGDGQYTIIHVAAGTGDYTLPTVDGDATRLLVGSYSPDSGGILAITSAGTSDPTLLGDLKMVERDGPFQAFTRADWLRLNLNPANADQTPLIDATAQQYPDGAAPPTSATGDGSIYTFATGSTAVADYVEASAEAGYEDAAQCLDDLADPTYAAGFPVGVAEDDGSRVVLEPLSADQPNVVDYDDIAGAALIQFSPGPNPGVSNPLIIRVPAGTTEVIGARADPQGAISPYMLWDLSALTGEVTVTAAEGRMDGSIYAPEADVTVDAAPLDGQIIGNSVTTSGGEIHSFLFAGQITCTAADDGTFRIRKDVTGIDPTDPLLAEVVFTVNYTATTPDDVVTTGSFALPATGEWMDAGARFPTGTVITFEEVAPPTVPGYAWDTAVTITPNPLTIGSGDTADVVVANAATQLRGTFSVSKQVVDEDGAVPMTGTVPVSWAAEFGGTQTDAGTLDVPLDGTVATPPGDFPVGTVVVLTEDLSAVDPPDGYEWSTVGWDPGRTIRIADETTTAITLTNLLVPEEADRAVSVVKAASGDAADPRFGYAISYNTETGRADIPIELGTPTTLADLDPAAETLELAELVPTFDGEPVDVSAWANPVFRVTIDSETTEFTAGGFEGAVSDEDAIVSIPLSPDAAEIAIEVVNERATGTFTLSKQFEGLTAGAIPPGTTFAVTWTATDPVDTVTTGTVQLPADGTAVSPLDAAGDPIRFPYGTVVTFTEEAPPTPPGITWTGASFSPAQATIGSDSQEVVAVTVTNAVSVDTGTFLVAKELRGVTPDDVSVDEVQVTYVAITPDRTAGVGTFGVPLDGTPAAPLDAAGNPIQFPVGTHIGLTETPPDDALPDNFEWTQSVWSPGRSLVITGDDAEIPTATVVNTAAEYAAVSLTKTVADEAGLAPADTEYTVDWWVDSIAQPALTLTANETVASDRFLVGSILEATEATPAEVPGATWEQPVWTVDGQDLPVEANGHVVIPVSSHAETIAFEVTNTLAADAATAAFSIEKSVTGTAASLVPDDTVFPVEYRVDGGDPVAGTVGVGEPLVVDDVPADAVVEVREGALPAVTGVEWGAPSWSVVGEDLAADPDGWVTVPLTADDTVTLSLENAANSPLPATGGTFSLTLPMLAVAAIVLGALAIWRGRVNRV